MSSSEDERDPLFWGYRERTRAMLRHLIFERGLSPTHPLVNSYDHHLYLTTAHAEYSRAQELSPPGIDYVALRTVCYRGADLNFRYCDRVATSLYNDKIEDLEPRGNQRYWENRNQQGMGRQEWEGRKSWETDMNRAHDGRKY